MGLAEQVQPDDVVSTESAASRSLGGTSTAPAARMPLPATITDARMPATVPAVPGPASAAPRQRVRGWSEAAQLGRIDLSSLNVEGNVDPHGTTATRLGRVDRLFQ